MYRQWIVGELIFQAGQGGEGAGAGEVPRGGGGEPAAGEPAAAGGPGAGPAGQAQGVRHRQEEGQHVNLLTNCSKWCCRY